MAAGMWVYMTNGCQAVFEKRFIKDGPGMDVAVKKAVNAIVRDIEYFNPGDKITFDYGDGPDE